MRFNGIHSQIVACVLMLAIAPTKKAESAETEPLKVFILAGQSNMQGHGHVTWGCDPEAHSIDWYRANADGPRHVAGGFGSLRYHVENEPDKLGHLVDKEGNWGARDDVSIIWKHEGADGKKGPLSIGFGVNDETIGPEFGFGYAVGDRIEERVLLIKVAWGGKSLAVDFRPPSAVEKRGGKVGPYYSKMVESVNAILADLSEEFDWYQGQGYEIAGFGWHQGWNDRIDSGRVAEYEANLADFIRDIRSEWGKNSAFVIANTGIGGPDIKGKALDLVNAQAAVTDFDRHPEFRGNVACVDTRPFYRKHIPAYRQAYHWHWNGETHYLIGNAMGEAIGRLGVE